MVTFAIILSVILLIVILVVLFRIQVLVSIFRGSYKRDIGKSNRINAILLVLFLLIGGAAFAWSFIDSKEEMILPLASVHGEWTDSLFWVTMAVIGVVFVITQILLFMYSYKYQHRDDRRAYYFPHNNKLEIIWTVIPAITMAILVFSGWKAWSKITSPAPEESVVVEIMGKQFNWLARYPGMDGKLGVARTQLIDATNEIGIDFNDQNSMDDFIPREIHVPKGQPVLLKIRARDVLHSVYMPHFRVKMDAVPGMPTSFWFVPTKTTAEMQMETGNPDFKYELACAEVCGRGHFAMRMLIVVDEPDEYLAWVAEQKPFIEQNPDLLAKFKTGAEKLVLNEKTAEEAGAAIKSEL